MRSDAATRTTSSCSWLPLMAAGEEEGGAGVQEKAVPSAVFGALAGAAAGAGAGLAEGVDAPGGEQMGARERFAKRHKTG